MKKIGRILVFFFAISLLNVILSTKSYAYLDPGSGAYLLQIICIGLACVIYGFKVVRDRIKLFFAGLFRKKPKEKGMPAGPTIRGNSLKNPGTDESN